MIDKKNKDDTVIVDAGEGNCLPITTKPAYCIKDMVTGFFGAQNDNL